MWLMRQAGRYLPEYRALRKQAGSFLDLCYNPEMAAEVTLQPIRRDGFDAAILFSDILVVPHAMGLSLDFVEGEGPRLETVSDVGRVLQLSDGDSNGAFSNVFETVRRVKASLAEDTALIGFCGGPWTVASYMIEGGSSDRKRGVAVAVANPEWFKALLEKLVRVSVRYLVGQINAGAQVLQIFDSWAGDVPSSCRQRVVVDPIRKIIDGVRAVYPGFPIIVFARGVGNEHGSISAATSATAVGVENGVDLSEVLKGVAVSTVIQGNLSPEILLGPWDVMKVKVEEILRQLPMERHIFNLGHGILPDVRPETVAELVGLVRAFDNRVH